MTYRPERDTPRDRVRSVTGDTTDPPILAGGEAAYDALLAAAASEHAAAIRACRELAGQLAQQPDAIGSGGESVSWRSRIAYLLGIANGETGTGLAGDPRLAPAARSAPGVRIGQLTAGREAGDLLR